MLVLSDDVHGSPHVMPASLPLAATGEGRFEVEYGCCELRGRFVRRLDYHVLEVCARLLFFVA